MQNVHEVTSLAHAFDLEDAAIDGVFGESSQPPRREGRSLWRGHSGDRDLQDGASRVLVELAAELALWRLSRHLRLSIERAAEDPRAPDGRDRSLDGQDEATLPFSLLGSDGVDSGRWETRCYCDVGASSSAALASRSSPECS